MYSSKGSSELFLYLRYIAGQLATEFLYSAEKAHNQGVSMRKAFLLAIAASAIYFTGCSTTKPQAGWVKPDVSKYDTENALAQCEYDVSMQKLETPAEKEKTVKNCMIRQGFRYGYYE